MPILKSTVEKWVGFNFVSAANKVKPNPFFNFFSTQLPFGAPQDRQGSTYPSHVVEWDVLFPVRTTASTKSFDEVFEEMAAFS